MSIIWLQNCLFIGYTKTHIQNCFYVILHINTQKKNKNHEIQEKT